MLANLSLAEILMNENSGVERIITDFYAIVFMKTPLALQKRIAEGAGVSFVVLIRTSYSLFRRCQSARALNCASLPPTPLIFI